MHLAPQVAEFDRKMIRLKEALRKKHIKKIKWIFQNQLKFQCKCTLPLKDVVTIFDDIKVPQFAVNLLQKRTSMCTL